MNPSKSSGSGSRKGARPTNKAVQGKVQSSASDRFRTLDVLMSKFNGFERGLLILQIIRFKDVELNKYLPFVRVQCGDNVSTTDSLSRGQEKFMAEFCLEVDNNDSKVEISLCGSKFLKKDKVFGTKSIAVKDIANGIVTNEFVELKSIENNSIIGSILIDAVFVSAEQRNKSAEFVQNNYEMVRHALLSRDLVIICSLCRVVTSDDLSKTLVRVFGAIEKQPIRLLLQLIYRELKQTSSTQQLFRTDSMATKTTRNYLQMIAKTTFMDPILTPIINQIVGKDQQFDLSGPEADHHGRQLEYIAESALNTVCNSVDVLPVSVRKFFKYVNALVTQAFPDGARQGLGGLFFLRFVCPAIATPQRYRLVEPSVTVTNNESRALILVCKILQQCVSGVDFQKEKQMLRFNALRQRSEKQLDLFFEQLVIEPADGPSDDHRDPLSAEDQKLYFALIVGQLERNLDRVEKSIADDPRMETDEAKQRNTGMWKLFRTMLEQNKTPRDKH